jgi:D-alanine-D-alanine ligase
MIETLRIGLLYGGRSGEHEVSLRSAAAVYRHLDRGKYNCILIGISKGGGWYLQEGPLGEVPESLPIYEGEERELMLLPGKGITGKQGPVPVDCVLPILHGSFGEDGTVQGALEIAGVPYAASGVLGSALGMDKGVVKKIWAYHGLPVVPYKMLRKEEYRLDSAEFERAVDGMFSEFIPPVFVKPNCAGSSLGVWKTETGGECRDAVRDAFRYDHTVLLEQGIRGKEIECAVLAGSPPEVSIPGQIVPKGEFYDYAAKYIDEDGAKLVIPADLDTNTAETIRDLTARAFLSAETEGYARVDFFVEEKTGRVYINEINTIPGFTSISMFPRLFIASGKTFGGILDSIIHSALKRAGDRRDIIYSYEP